MHGNAISTRLGPTEERARLPLPDLLRGFALAGILLINIEDFSAPNVAGLGAVWPDRADQIAGLLLRFAAEGKFRALFALLFGLGFALQLERSECGAAPFRARYIRRCGVLLLIGLAHYLLLWEADILMVYALVGLLLLPFERRSAGTALRAAGAMAGAAVALLCLIALLAHPRAQGSPHRNNPVIPAEKVQMAYVYGRGSYGEVVSYRARQLGTQLVHNLGMAPLTLMLFLVGLAAGKAGFPRRPDEHRTLLRRLFFGCLVFGIVSNAIVAIYAPRLMSLPKLLRLPIAASYVLGGPALALAYASGLTLLFLHPAWGRRLQPLAAPGRLALTNYLLQSAICGILFYGYGLGWYNHLRPVVCIGLCIVIYLVQMAASAWWLRHFRYGPAEWLWRSLTYWRVLPLRR
jgi:uncharacterized protein